MTKTEVLNYFGTKTKVAKILNYASPSGVAAWPEKVPAEAQFKLEIITEGLLKVDDDLVPKIRYVKENSIDSSRRRFVKERRLYEQG